MSLAQKHPALSFELSPAEFDYPWPLAAEPSVPARKPVWKSGELKMQPWNTNTQKMPFEESLYTATVLGLASTATEDELDAVVSLEAQSLGVLPAAAPATSTADGLSSSISVMTIASDSVEQSPVRTQSTAPTSCASSEHRPPTRSSRVSGRSPSIPDVPPLVAEHDNKKQSPIRRGLRKIPGFRKKKSGALTTSSTLTSISSDAETNDSWEASEDIRSSSSIKSNASPTTFPGVVSTHELPPPPVDMEALKRSMECQKLLDLRISQLEQKARFLEFQASLFAQLRAQRDLLKAQKRAEHDLRLAEEVEKNERAIEDFEARQLEEEMKMEQEHELEKRAVMLRLRHMEAYCQNPTPPSTPVDSSPGHRRSSTDHAFLPERKVTDKDYHNLAQQYRERDIMDGLHASKINVLRGRQKKAVEKLMQRKAMEMQALERDQKKELALIDRDFTGQETDARLALDTKRARLESRWRLQASIEQKRMEITTGLKYAPLANVVALENVNFSPRKH